MHRIWRILGHILPDEVQDLTQDMEAMRISNFAKKMEHLIQILTKLEAKVKSNINIQCDIDAELSEALQILQNILKEKQASNDVSLTEMFSVQFALNKMTELQDMAKLSSKLADFFKLDTHIR